MIEADQQVVKLREKCQELQATLRAERRARTQESRLMRATIAKLRLDLRRAKEECGA